MSFGLCNAPSTFQRLMEKIFWAQHCQSMFLYLDDVIIFSSSVAEHMECLDAVLENLKLCGRDVIGLGCTKMLSAGAKSAKGAR